MTRDIKIYLLIVVLPAVLLVAGGIRLVALERGRARAMAVESLDAKAADLARQMAEKLRESGCQCRDAAPPPRPPRDDERRPWRRARQRRKPDAGCRFHQLPQDASAVIRGVVESQEQPMACAVEVRHACGECVLPLTDARITGAIFGSAQIKPMLSSYSVCVAPAGGDAAVALGARTQAMFAAILVFLLFATMSAGVVLLVRSARRAKAEARAKTDFLSNVSHELKTPLTSMAMFAEMLERGSVPPDAARTASATISREAKRLARLIDGLLEYARLERGARKYELSDFDVLGVLEDARDAFAHSFPDGLEIIHPPAEPPAIVRADREATRRIIDCLLENAAKYAAGASVEIRIESNDGGICVSVADQGPGIPEDDAPHVFERFWRADNSVTRTTGGAGLGLAIARELAIGMGASLSLRPNSPTGAVFALAFPAVG